LDIMKKKIIHLKTVDSTNTYLKLLAEKGEKEGCVVVSDKQTSGRGRRGKSFFSPDGTGLYMSFLLQPEFSPDEALFITPCAAVATARAIEFMTKKPCLIKWVNDIYVDSKKVAGILTEGSFDFEKDKTNYVIVGVGVNVLSPLGDFPEELRTLATSLDCGDIREKLSHKILEEFFKLYKDFKSHSFIKEYKERSFIVGKTIEVMGYENIKGRVLEIDDCCRLVIELPDKTKKVLTSGEVSTKII